MKYKRLILLLSIILIFTIYIGAPYLEERFNTIDGFKKNIIRFHVRANSDKREDQELKLEVRDEILDYMDGKLDNASSIEESRKILNNHIDDIKSISEKVIKKWDKDYEVRVSLDNHSFPIRKYGNIVLPQGDYEALLVEIGEAKGENWWCVMFPPLCFVDVTHSTAVKPASEDTLNEFVVDETKPFKLKSIVADFFKKIFKADASNNNKLGYLDPIESLNILFI